MTDHDMTDQDAEAEALNREEHEPEVPKRWYIQHEDLQTPSNGTAYFGPFGDDEITDRLNDALADLFADSGNVDGVEMTDAEAEATFINPRAWWMNELAQTE